MKRLFTLSIVALALSASAFGAVTLEDFRSNSLLSSGRWVKFEVDDTGIYEISFAKLKEMGFDNPETVAIYGHGGKQMSEMLTNKNGVIEDHPDLQPVPCEVLDDKIVFYGLGVEDITLTVNSAFENNARFLRTSKNIYQNKGHYLITDSQTPARVSEIEGYDTEAAVEYISGVDYYYYEKDLQYNPQKSGKIYFGETYTSKISTFSFPFSLQDYLPGTKSLIQVDVYYDSASNREFKVTFASDGSGVTKTTPSSTPPAYSLLPQFFEEVDVPAASDVLKLSYTLYSNYSRGWLDFWLLTYPRAVPTLQGENQGRIAFPKANAGESFFMGVPQRNNVVAWDVTNPQNPKRLAIENNEARGTVGDAAPRLVVFDPSKPMKSIGAFEEVENSDLHAQAAEGADYVIITTRAMEPKAQELAALHITNGTSTKVFTTDKLYNEFSGGNPDPMAYRWLVKRMSLNSNPVQNLLLFGPMTSDLRGLTEPKDPLANIIAIQNTTVSRTTGASNPNDIFGVMTDYYSEKNYEQEMSVGVGVLPVRNETEASIAIEKSARHLGRTDFAWYLNNLSHISCPGDKHLHEKSAIEAADRLQLYSQNPYVISPIVFDAYPNMSDARQKWFDSLVNGNLMTWYFGHGDVTGFATSMEVINPTHILSLKNERLPFCFLAGCSLTNFDRDANGIAEKMIINTPAGFLGGFVSSRETYANENRSIINYLLRAIAFDMTNTMRPKPVTLGKIVADCKTRLSITNEHLYHLMADPALVVPFPTLTADAEVKTNGSAISISGSIKDQEDAKTEYFNGEIVARLMAPAKEIASGNYYSKETSELLINYADEALRTVSGSVENGQFSLTMPVGALDPSVDFNLCSISLAAYDADNVMSMALNFPLENVEDLSTPEPLEDTQAPEIVSLEYDAVSNSIIAVISDDSALNLSTAAFGNGPELYLDGALLHASRAMMTGVGENAMQLIYPLDALQPGDHNAMLTVADLNGNSAKGNIGFSVLKNDIYTLARSQNYDPAANFELTLEGNPTAETTVVVTTIGGTDLLRATVGELMDGNVIRIPAEAISATGLYKVYLSGPEGFSNVLNMPVLL